MSQFLSIKAEGAYMAIDLTVSDDAYTLLNSQAQEGVGESLEAYALANPRDFVRDILSQASEDTSVQRIATANDGTQFNSYELGTEIVDLLVPRPTIDLDITKVVFSCFATPPDFEWPRITTYVEYQQLMRQLAGIVRLAFRLTVEPPNLAW